MPDKPDEYLGQPNNRPWFSRLLNLFQRDSHASTVQLDDDGLIDHQAANQNAQMMDMLNLSSDRKIRQDVFEEMDTFGLVSAILTAYAEETTQPDYETGKSVWIESKNNDMISAGKDCLQNIQIEDRITPIARRVAKTGDAFQRLMYQTEKGVLGWKAVDAKRMLRRDDKFGRLVGFKETGIKFRHKERTVSFPWDYTHFRLLGSDEMSGYGTGFCKAMFRPWRLMTLTQDAALSFRLRRNPDRNLVQINVGNMEDHDAMEWVQKWRKKFRTHEFVDPASPNYKKKYNPLTPLEDVFVPLVDGRESRIDTMSGGGMPDDLYDLMFYRDEFFGSVGAPKAYFGFEGDVNSKATLQQQDIRWARACKRLRKSLVYGLRQTLDIHYTLLDPEKYSLGKSANDYTVQMSPISYLDEFQRIELLELRYRIVESTSRLAQDMQLDSRVWATYILLNYAKLPEDLVLKLIKKTPDQQGGAGGGGMFASSEVSAKLTEEDSRPSSGGFYDISPEEQITMARAIHESPELRKVIGDISMYFADEKSLSEASSRQTDSSLLPPFVGGRPLSDGCEDDADVQMLKEDLSELIDEVLED
jgi:hypothetical protein